MGLKADLKLEVKNTFSTTWEVNETAGVPDPKGLRLNSNHAKDLKKATVLYADLDGSTAMVDKKKWEFSASVYKAFLRCAGQIIKSEGGVITAYDGDRVMAVFTGDQMATRAVQSALKLNHAVLEIIQPALNTYYSTDFKLGHVVGIDSTQLRCARVGVHGDNDLVWIGRAANYAAKLTSLPGYSTRVTKAVYDATAAELKRAGNGSSLWSAQQWTAMNDLVIYGTNATVAFT